jgi:3,4-dihydroxy-2-butanone 4-phosphate synthase
MSLASVEQAIADIRAGKLVIVADDENRENEGDLVGSAELVTPAMINFMATHGRGLICLTLIPERCQALGLPPMAEQNTEAHETAFTVSIDAAARFGVTTGISAADRAATVRVAIDPASTPSDLRRPGHVFPLRARPGGVLQRVGQRGQCRSRAVGGSIRRAICEILSADNHGARPSWSGSPPRTGCPHYCGAAGVPARDRTVGPPVAGHTDAVGEFRIINTARCGLAEHVALVFGDVWKLGAVILHVSPATCSARTLRLRL